MTTQLTDLIKFTQLTLDIRSVKRAVYVPGENQYENDSEHGYQVALLALYIIQYQKLELDTFKAMVLAIVHDVVEVYAGDTHAFGDQAELDTKVEREQQAQVKLKQLWPEVPLLHDLIEEYETKSSPESRFIYALDKITPMINSYLDGGRNWKELELSLEEHQRVVKNKIDQDATVQSYYEDIIDFLATKPELFSKI
jgi:putative hydrolases of HD superfamily